MVGLVWRRMRFPHIVLSFEVFSATMLVWRFFASTRHSLMTGDLHSFHSFCSAICAISGPWLRWLLDIPKWFDGDELGKESALEVCPESSTIYALYSPSSCGLTKKPHAWGRDEEKNVLYVPPSRMLSTLLGIVKNIPVSINKAISIDVM